MKLEPEDVRIETSNILLKIGVPNNRTGFRYLTKAIEICVADPTVIFSGFRDLYTQIAIAFAVQAKQVEDSIRRAINFAWNKNKILRLNNLLGTTTCNLGEKMKNTEFIALLANRIPYLLRARH